MSTKLYTEAIAEARKLREVAEAKDLPSFWATLDDALDPVTGTEKGAKKFLGSKYSQEMAEKLRSMGYGRAIRN